jgi:CRP-like cAMP-binding protein
MTTKELESREVFEFLRPEQMRTLSEAAESTSLRAGEFVYHQGAAADHFFVLLSGQVALRLPQKEGMSLQINELTSGAMFGSCVCFEVPNYSLTAQCTEDARLLSIRADTLKRLMEDDLVMGYAIQTRISRVYFQRYIDAMRMLQGIVQTIPLQPERPIG